MLYILHIYINVVSSLVVQKTEIYLNLVIGKKQTLSNIIFQSFGGYHWLNRWMNRYFILDNIFVINSFPRIWFFLYREKLCPFVVAQFLGNIVQRCPHLLLPLDQYSLLIIQWYCPHSRFISKYAPHLCSYQCLIYFYHNGCIPHKRFKSKKIKAHL